MGHTVKQWGNLLTKIKIMVNILLLSKKNRRLAL